MQQGNRKRSPAKRLENRTWPRATQSRFREAKAHPNYESVQFDGKKLNETSSIYPMKKCRQAL